LIKDLLLFDWLQEPIAAHASAQGLHLFFDPEQMHNFGQLFFRMDLSHEIAEDKPFPF